MAVTLRRSVRARRLSLRVSHLDGRVTLSLPHRAPLREALAFLNEREEWIRAALARQPLRATAQAGTAIPVEGRNLVITPGRVLRVAIAENLLLVPHGKQPGPAIAAFLKRLARERLEAACLRHSARANRPISAITLRDTRSRWGSCTADGRLMFSWRLILAPADVLDYVAAHEVAHLVHMDHSAAFWAEVARLMPDYATHRAWLRKHGHQLHSVDFG